MDPRLKSSLLRIFPRRLFKNFVPLNNLLERSRSGAARREFENSRESGLWLGLEDLARIFDGGIYCSPQKYDYSPESVNKRGRERFAEISGILGSKKANMKSLEVGACDARTSFYLARAGLETHAIDLTPSHYSKEVVDSGVVCRVMSATDLDYPPDSFDIVFSYNTFEHIDDPDKALSEAIRVVKPGGFIYLQFGPVWSAPYGAHGQHAITIPYMQFLWEKELLLEFCAARNLGTIEFHTLNQWPAGKYKGLWEKYSTALKTRLYREHFECHGSELIEKFPGCFRGKVDDFNELITSVIEVLFVKV